MKRLFVIALVVLSVSASFAQRKGKAAQQAEQPKQNSYMITTLVPKRPATQKDVIALATEKIPNLRVAFIGVGMRGPSHVEAMINIPNVEVVALCDVVKENVEKCNRMITEAGKPKALEFYGDTAVWRKVTKLPNVDLVIVSTDWQTHAMMGVQAMKDGKHVAIEVPAAMNLDEIWALINTSEQTRKHCMQLENCVYDFFELTTLNMAQQGLLGEVLHGEGAYIHNLEPFWNSYWNNWRLEYNINNRGDVYPTHGIGPVCFAMDIHRGDKMNYLTSMQTKTVCIPEFIKKTTGRDVSENFQNGDHTSTLIKTEKGKTILIEHNVATPRPYDRMYQLTGTKGFVNKYPEEGIALAKSDAITQVATANDDLSGHNFLSDSTRKALITKYQHPIVSDELVETAKKVGGHGGMDFIMIYRLVHCLQNGLPLDMDVYDLAEWCALTPLTKISIENNSAPVAIPDFTRGGWEKLPKLQFAE